MKKIKTKRTEQIKRWDEKRMYYTVPAIFAEGLELECKHWKNNHDHLVKFRSMIMKNPDLKERCSAIIALNQEMNRLNKLRKPNKIILFMNKISCLNILSVSVLTFLIFTILKIAKQDIYGAAFLSFMFILISLVLIAPIVRK